MIESLKDFDLFICIVGFIVGFMFFTIITNMINHDKKYSIIIPICGKNFHLHHWLLCLIILIIVGFYSVSQNPLRISENILVFTIGFLIGSIIHGLTYNDCFKIYY